MANRAPEHFFIFFSFCPLKTEKPFLYLRGKREQTKGASQMIGTKTIFLAQWSHKHGQDISAHKTEKGAFDQCVYWMRECLGEWYAPDDEDHDYYAQMSDEDLFASWTDITGEEYMTVETIALNG